MKKILLLLFICFALLKEVQAQAKLEKVSPDSLPESILPKQNLFSVNFPTRDATLKEIEAEINQAEDINEGITIGKNLAFNLDFDSLTTIVKDGKIYREVEIYSQGANTLSVNFSDIQLSESAHLFIINDQESYILGPLTSTTVSRNYDFDPGFISGDRIRVLLVESEIEKIPSKVTISRVGHIIFDFFGTNKYESSMSTGYGFGASAPCLQNIKCFSGLDLESKGVALITYTDPEDPFANVTLRGTGYLINNGSQNKRALFLSMIHGIGGYMVPDLKFMFHYKSPQCTPTTIGPTSFFVQGASNLVVDASNDLRLMQLTVNPYQNPVFSGNPVSFLGWSIIDEPVNNVHGIHHPKGDVQKYLTGGPVTAATEPGTTYGVWKFRLSNGFPETLSSGSPLLNPSNRVIGLCRAGAIEFNCSNFKNYDVYYVRLSRSWPLLCQYLDPNNEGIVALNTITGTAGPKVFTQIGGPNQICSSGVFNLLNAPLDLPISWSIVQGANLVAGPTSGQGKSATVIQLNPSASGQVKIRFTIQNMCGNRIFEKTFQLGPISSGQMTVTGSASVCPGNQYTYQANVPGGHQAGYVYQWTIPAGWSVQSQWNNMITLYVPSNYQDYGTVRFRVNNGCGYSGYSGITVFPCGLPYGVNIYPIPVSNELQLEITQQNGEELPARIAGSENFEIGIYGTSGEKMFSFTTSETQISIDVSQLKNGSYYLHILHKDGLIRRQIRVER